MVCSFKCGEIYKQNHIKQNTPVKKVSESRKVENTKYAKLRKAFLSLPENKYCKIKGSNCTKLATTIEHSFGRIGDNYLKISTWIPSCLNCNLELERNPELSKKHQFSRFHEGKKIEK